VIGFYHACTDDPCRHFEDIGRLVKREAAMTWKDGDDVDEKAAKEATREMLKDARHKRDQGSKDDLATVDDPIETPDEGEGEN
jgi:hypothetical protein